MRGLIMIGLSALVIINQTNTVGSLLHAVDVNVLLILHIMLLELDMHHALEPLASAEVSYLTLFDFFLTSRIV